MVHPEKKIPLPQEKQTGNSSLSLASPRLASQRLVEVPPVLSLAAPNSRNSRSGNSPAGGQKRRTPSLFDMWTGL